VPAAPFNLNHLHDRLTTWPLSQGETRQPQGLIGNTPVDAYENFGTDLNLELFQLMLPASLLRVLVELLAPIADNPRASTNRTSPPTS
jgi:hypothetical protein